MDDMELGRELVREWRRHVIGSDDDYTRIGARARALLAKPVATREAVQDFWRERFDLLLGNNDASRVIAALSHFAPPASPRMLIEGMKYTEIRDAMVNECANAGGKLDEHDHEMTQWCARVAHRLANTPAPKHDPDLEFGREILEMANAKLPEGRPGLTYTDDYARAVGRAVAATKKEKSDE